MPNYDNRYMFIYACIASIHLIGSPFGLLYYEYGNRIFLFVNVLFNLLFIDCALVYCLFYLGFYYGGFGVFVHPVCTTLFSNLYWTFKYCTFATVAMQFEFRNSNLVGVCVCVCFVYICELECHSNQFAIAILQFSVRLVIQS